MKKVVGVVAVLLVLIGLNEVAAQTYTPPKYKNGPKDFSNYILDYVKLFDLLPHEKDYSEIFPYTVFISKDGVVKFANVIGKDLDIRTEIKRVMRLSDKWQPATLNGIDIDTTYTDTIRVCSTVGSENTCALYDSIRTIQYYRVPLLGSPIGTYSINTDVNKGIKIYNEGRNLFVAKDYKGAIATFEEAIENLYRPKKEPVFNIGVCYFQLNNLDSACKYFLEAARLGDSEAEKIYKERCKNAPTVASKTQAEQPKTLESNGETMPEFLGGDRELILFLQKNLRYPVRERNNDIQGKVLTKFVVNEDGHVSDITIVKGVSPGIDSEAVRIINLFPNFKPATKQGKPVKVYFDLPIRFMMN